jgi:uncharacterized membrane protein YeaQ/YmgE (transglycosylase-associated protein family)
MVERPAVCATWSRARQTRRSGEGAGRPARSRSSIPFLIFPRGDLHGPHEPVDLSCHWRSGRLAGVILKGGGFGLLVNIVVGILGAIVGGYAFSLLGISAGGIIGSIITATVGAVLLLLLFGLLKKAA